MCIGILPAGTSVCGCQIPWSWTYRLLLATKTGSQYLNLGPLQEQSVLVPTESLLQSRYYFLNEANIQFKPKGKASPELAQIAS